MLKFRRDCGIGCPVSTESTMNTFATTTTYFHMFFLAISYASCMKKPAPVALRASLFEKP
jgi:hypothetical protein